MLHRNLNARNYDAHWVYMAVVVLGRSEGEGHVARDQVFFIFLIAGGHILLPGVLATFALSKHVKRDPAMISFVISWVIYSMTMSLL